MELPTSEVYGENTNAGFLPKKVYDENTRAGFRARQRHGLSERVRRRTTILESKSIQALVEETTNESRPVRLTPGHYCGGK